MFALFYLPQINHLIFSKEVNFEANLLPRPEIIITAKVIESFQNFSYIGEMRRHEGTNFFEVSQAWEEIKKLKNSPSVSLI